MDKRQCIQVGFARWVQCKCYFYCFCPFDTGDDLMTNPFQEEGNDEIEDKVSTSMWDEAYSDPI